MSIILFAFVAFALTAWSGLRFYRASVWEWIDAVYFPLAGLALILFFTSNEVHHDFLNVSQTLLVKRVGTNQEQARKLGVARLDSIMPGGGLPREFGQIQDLTRFARTCGSDPVALDSEANPAALAFQPGYEARCVAARKFLSGLQIFDVETRRQELTPGERPVDKLYAGCNAADAMVDEFVLGGRISKSVAEGTSVIYKSFRTNEVNSVRFRTEIVPEIQRHVAEIKSQIASGLQESGAEASGPESRTVKVRMYEAEISGLILEALLPCAEFTPIDLESLRDVVHRDSLFAARQTHFDQQREEWSKTREQAAIHPFMAWLRFRLWPYLIVVVVALKFGRVLATQRLDRRESAG